MSRPGLSIVVPVYNEAAVLDELVRRCLSAAGETGRTFELILVDDASTDATMTLAASLARGPVRHLRLMPNRGQFGATQAGLAAASGEFVAVLDGDLQDPPEVIPALVDSLSAWSGGNQVAFAVKTCREDPPWFRAGAASYRALQKISRGARVPAGAGTFCVMPWSMARAVALLPTQSTNLSAVLVALGASAVAVPYEKAARISGRSRVGFPGLVREALGSLLLTGALSRLAWLVALTAIVVAIILAVSGHPGSVLGVLVGAGFAGLAAWLVFPRRRRLTPHSPRVSTGPLETSSGGRAGGA